MKICFKQIAAFLYLLAFYFPASTLVAQPQPLPADPGILALAQQVNADTLASTIDNLVGFHTRHTYSDTLSTTTGIGAARSWVLGEYDRHGADAFLFPWMGSWNSTPHQCYNASGSYGGTGTIERYILLGGHLDSRSVDPSNISTFAPGADDDGSGVAATIEIARLLANQPMLPTIISNAFTGEEQGLLGSGAMAEQFADQGKTITAMLNMDMLAHVVHPDGTLDTSTVRIYSADPQSSSSRQMARYAKWVGEAYSDGLTVTLIPAEDRPGRGGDHSSFSDEGFTAIRVIETGEDVAYQHGDTDIPEAMDFNYFRKNVRLVLGVTATLGQAPEAPGAPTVVNAGGGQDVIVSWPANWRPDGGVVRAAVRRIDETYWSYVATSESGTSIQLSDLVDGEEYAFSLSVSFENGLPSPFGPETILQLTSEVLPPDSIDATSTFEGPRIQWRVRNEPFVTQYAIERATMGGEFSQVGMVNQPVSEYLDETAEVGTLYRYRVSSGTAEDVFSLASSEVLGAVAGHSEEVLLIDATPDGTGAVGSPTDESVDAFYSGLFDNPVPHLNWDRADSMAVGRHITDADLALHGAVIIHADGLNHSFAEDTTAIRKYMQNGGRLILIGWRLSASLGASNGFETNYPEGHLFRDLFGIASSTTTPISDIQFTGATGLQPLLEMSFNQDIYPTLPGALPIMDVLTLDDSGISYPTYFFNAVDGEESPYDGGIVGIQDSREMGSWVVIDVPWSVMSFPFEVVEQAVHGIGLITLSSPEENLGVIRPNRFEITQTYPNPFNPSITCTITLPFASLVKLSILNLLGQEVAVLHDSVLESGRHALEWNATGFASGVYLVRLQHPEGADIQKVMLLK